MSNPSTMRVTLSRSGKITFYNGAQDIGQGSSTVLRQILAQALGVPLDAITSVGADTDLTADAGKSSASRQTYVSGKAAQLAGEVLRRQLIKLANVGPDATLMFDGSTLRVIDGQREHVVALESLTPLVASPAHSKSASNGHPQGQGLLDDDPREDDPLEDDPLEDDRIVLEGIGQFDPPTTALDADGQGNPYGTYGFAAQVVALEVDTELGTIRLQRIVAAHDVGKAINPTLVEGQIQGGIAQGIGLALMEEYIPGRTENLHDYLIPTVGDVPPIECLLIEAPEPTGPFGAKGIGEPALVPTAPAILNALYHAIGVRMRRLPILPHRVREAIAAGGNND